MKFVDFLLESESSYKKQLVLMKRLNSLKRIVQIWIDLKDKY